LKVAEEHLLRQKWADAPALAALRGEIVREIEEAVAQVQREPRPIRLPRTGARFNRDI